MLIVLIWFSMLSSFLKWFFGFLLRLVLVVILLMCFLSDGSIVVCSLMFKLIS